MKSLIPIFATSVLLTAPVLAALAPEQGLSGNITVLTMTTSNSSALDVKQDKSQSVADLNSSGSAQVSVLPGLLGSLQYTFGDELNKQLFMGTSRDDIVTGSLAFEIGYRQQFASGMVFDISALPTLISGEVWDDPYAVDEARNKTDLTGNVIRMQLSQIAGSNFSVDMAAGESDVDEERSGTKGLNLTPDEQKHLTRERNYFYLKTGYRYFLPEQQAILQPSLHVTSSRPKGEALSFVSYGGELSYARKIERHGFVLTASAALRDYDAQNPVFSQTRKDKDYSLFLAYEYTDILGYQDWALVSFVGAKTTQSNIDYYTSEQYVVSVGLDYKF
ncbi:hypothetical protein VII00023_03573 [Vibrio ichthyoenteri ATCC 700023]|uniref:Periplasmic protein n=1 Tax=Vibrio ichthyoenteri ATCC 700023 TaxID=870968 RepID=F9RWQ2_9VIBR|nr:DUF2860 family protein [Vibrio ichthyoenteri]EGU48982.1 hypothetical protein VII00023_03573 [Vibrio ichthyoenteri ATCC 700023]